MTIDWWKFLSALLLLLVPGDLFNGGVKVRYRDVTREWHGYWLRVLTHGMHTIDLGRAALGTWLLLDSLHGAPDARGLLRYAPLVTQGGIRIAAVLVQTLVCREKDAINAPFTFVVGLLLAGISPVVAFFAVALAAPVAAGMRAPVAFFPVVAVAHLAIGFWFRGRALGGGASFAVLPSLALAAIAAMVPFLWSLMFRRDLVVAYRAKPRSAETNSPLR
jgi:hypothetical protein